MRLIRKLLFQVLPLSCPIVLENLLPCFCRLSDSLPDNFNLLIIRDGVLALLLEFLFSNFKSLLRGSVN